MYVYIYIYIYIYMYIHIYIIIIIHLLANSITSCDASSMCNLMLVSLAFRSNFSLKQTLHFSFAFPTSLLCRGSQPVAALSRVLY
jgi:hypothetical protein